MGGNFANPPSSMSPEIRNVTSDVTWNWSGKYRNGCSLIKKNIQSLFLSSEVGNKQLRVFTTQVFPPHLRRFWPIANVTWGDISMSPEIPSKWRKYRFPPSEISLKVKYNLVLGFAMVWGHFRHRRSKTQLILLSGNTYTCEMHENWCEWTSYFHISEFWISINLPAIIRHGKSIFRWNIWSQMQISGSDIYLREGRGLVGNVRMVNVFYFSQSFKAKVSRTTKIVQFP